MTATTQQMEALAWANTKRLAVAELKRTIRNLPPRKGAEFLADVIENDHDDPIRGIGRIRQLLDAVKGIGEQGATRCLIKAGVHNYDKRLRDLTPRQRAAVALQLRIWASTRSR